MVANGPIVLITTAGCWRWIALAMSSTEAATRVRAGPTARPGPGPGAGPAAWAGLTTRTFFRHFADKREVLFGGDEVLARASQLMADAPAALDPAALIVEGLRTVAETRFEGRRAEVRERRAIIRSDEGLRERDLRKRADVAAVIRAGLISRGVAATTAALLADSTVTVLYVALDQWLDQDGDQPLFEIMLRTLGSLQEALGSLVTGDLSVSRPAG